MKRSTSDPHTLGVWSPGTCYNNYDQILQQWKGAQVTHTHYAITGPALTVIWSDIKSGPSIRQIVFSAFSFLGLPAAIIEYNGHNLSTRLPGRRVEISSDIILSFSGKRRDKGERKEERGEGPSPLPISPLSLLLPLSLSTLLPSPLPLLSLSPSLPSPLSSSYHLNWVH